MCKTMKHYRRKKRDINTYYRKESKCWSCSNCYSGCSWSCDFIPVNGWKAEKTYISSNGEYAESYKVIECPEYMEDVRK